MATNLTIYPAKILAGILAGFLSVFIQNLLPLFVTVTGVAAGVVGIKASDDTTEEYWIIKVS